MTSDVVCIGDIYYEHLRDTTLITWSSDCPTVTIKKKKLLLIHLKECSNGGGKLTEEWLPESTVLFV